MSLKQEHSTNSQKHKSLGWVYGERPAKSHTTSARWFRLWSSVQLGYPSGPRVSNLALKHSHIHTHLPAPALAPGVGLYQSFSSCLCQPRGNVTSRRAIGSGDMPGYSRGDSCVPEAQPRSSLPEPRQWQK